MAANKENSARSNVTNIADAKRKYLDQSSIPFGRRPEDGEEPNLAARRLAEQTDSEAEATGEKRSSGRRFNKVKVDKIKGQLERGEYTINPLRVADMFIEHERHR